MQKILMVVWGVCCLSWNAFAFDLNQIQVHGFASQGYLRSNHYDYLDAETEKGTVEFNEFGLNVTSNLTDHLRFGVQLLARDLGNDGDDKLTIDWAFGDYRYRNWAGLRFGKIKRAMGLYNQSRDIDASRMGVFLPLSAYDESFRVVQGSIIGIGGYGTLPGGFEYQVQYGALDPEVESWARSSLGATSVDGGNDGYALHLEWNTPLDGLRTVGSFNRFSWTQGIVSGGSLEFKIEIPLVGIEYTRGNLTCAAEYLQLKLTTKGQEPWTSIYSWTSEYYYGLLSYQLTDWIEVGTSYAVMYQEKDDKEGNSYALQGQPRALAWRKDLALSARFDINEYWIVKLEGHWFNGLFWVSGYGSNPSEDGFLGAVKVTFSF
jgi:hypothetical protein